MKKELILKIENENQKDSLFYPSGKICARIEVMDYEGKDYTLYAMCQGDKRVYNKDGERIENELINLYDSDEKLKEDLVNKNLTIDNNNWYTIFINGFGHDWITDDVFVNLEDFISLIDDDNALMELINNTVKYF